MGGWAIEIFRLQNVDWGMGCRLCWLVIQINLMLNRWCYGLPRRFAPRNDGEGVNSNFSISTTLNIIKNLLKYQDIVV